MYNYIPIGPVTWRPSADGVARVGYLVNPQGIASEMTDAEIIGAVRAAFETWGAASPGLEFVYEGTTNRAPVPHDGYSVVGAAPASGGAHATVNGDRDGFIVEADIAIWPGAFTWQPCEQADDSCTKAYYKPHPELGYYNDLQDLVSHEVGHWVALADLTGEHHPIEVVEHLTMYNGPYGKQFTDRRRNTLALGDVLGLRSMYPCGCPLPPIYSP